jgi:hypothetical protein
MEDKVNREVMEPQENMAVMVLYNQLLKEISLA